MPNTVFIVGAGAATEFGFPIGSILQEEVAEILRPKIESSEPLSRAIEYSTAELAARGRSGKSVMDLCDWMSRTLPLYPSIDVFLDRHSEEGDAVSYLGKLAILQVIAQREADSLLSQSQSSHVDWKTASGTWLGKLWARMNTAGLANRAENPLPGVSFITFNYDRSIEQFLIMAVAQSYDIAVNDARDIAQRIPVEHIYGAIAPIFGSTEFASFGSIRHPSQYPVYAKNIKTFTEQVDSATARNVFQILDEAERIVFLGFSFGEMNRQFFEEALESNGYRGVPQGRPLREILGTSFRMSGQDSKVAEDWASQCFNHSNHNVHFLNSEAAHLFNTYSLKFSA